MGVNAYLFEEMKIPGAAPAANGRTLYRSSTAGQGAAVAPAEEINTFDPGLGRVLRGFSVHEEDGRSRLLLHVDTGAQGTDPLFADVIFNVWEQIGAYGVDLPTTDDDLSGFEPIDQRAASIATYSLTAETLAAYLGFLSDPGGFPALVDMQVHRDNERTRIITAHRTA